MRAKVEKGYVKLDLQDLIDVVCENTDAIQSIACNSEIIKYVVQQIIDGWTENMSHGGVCVDAIHTPTTGLDWAIRQISLKANDIAVKEIKRLEDALKESNEQYQNLLSNDFIVKNFE